MYKLLNLIDMFSYKLVNLLDMILYKRTYFKVNIYFLIYTYNVN